MAFVPVPPNDLMSQSLLNPGMAPAGPSVAPTGSSGVPIPTLLSAPAQPATADWMTPQPGFSAPQSPDSQPEQQGLGGFLNNSGAGNMLQAVGLSLMSSPRNNPFAGVGGNLQQLQTQTMRQKLMDQEQAELAQQKQQQNRTQAWIAEKHPDLLEAYNASQETGMKLAIERQQRTQALNDPTRRRAADNIRGMGFDDIADGLEMGALELSDAWKSAVTRRSGGDPSAAEDRINRLTENLMQTGTIVDPVQARNVAVGIVDDRMRVSRHPVTGEQQIIDMATGQPAYDQPQEQMPQGQPPQQTSQVDPFGEQYPAADDAFGVAGAVAGGLNAAGDAIGVGAPYPEVQATQADFGVLQEALLNDMGNAYNRQPPSWLLQEIRKLTPTAGNPLEGRGTATSKLNAIGRQLNSELQIAQQALTRELSPENRQETEAKVQGLEAGISRVQSALGAFDRSSETPETQDAGPAPDGIDPVDWQYMTPEDRALFQ